jgi:hypothetical protein
MNHFSLKTTAFALVTSTALGLIGFTGGCSSSTASADEACDNYFNAVYSDRCKSGSVSQERRGQIQGRFRDLCKKGLGANGSGITADFLDKCGSALSALPCGANETPAQCKTPAGTLAEGGACSDSSQCKSSFCKKGSTTTPVDGGASTQTSDCGVCAATVAEGGACEANGTVRCATDTTCVTTAGSTGTCVKLAESDIGGACGTSGTKCKSGIICDFKTLKCIARGIAGATCTSSNDCQQPDLACVAKVCKARVGEGAACTSTAECQTQLGCNPTSKTCGKRPTAKAGAPCDSFTVCDSGSCNATAGSPTGAGTCPTIIPDGQACKSDTRDAVCDEFANCKDGICKVEDPAVCK